MPGTLFGAEDGVASNAGGGIEERFLRAFLLVASYGWGVNTAVTCLFPRNWPILPLPKSVDKY